MKERFLDVSGAFAEGKTYENLGTGLAEVVLHTSAFVLACLQLPTCSIELVCDFRSPEERTEEPDRLPGSDPPDVAELPIFDESFSAVAFREKMLAGDDDFDPRAILIEGNRLFASKFSDRYAATSNGSRSRTTCPPSCTARRARTAPASRRR